MDEGGISPPAANKRGRCLTTHFSCGAQLCAAQAQLQQLAQLCGRIASSKVLDQGLLAIVKRKLHQQSVAVQDAGMHLSHKALC